MRLGRPSGRKPGPAGAAEDQRSRLGADEGEPPLALDGAVPDLEPELVLERGGEGGRIADEPDLGDSEQLGRREGAGDARLADAAVRDQLDDAPGRIMEVDRLRVPVREVEHRLARLGIGQELDVLARPRERRVEAVARDEEGDVVERRTCGLPELEHRLPDPHRHGTASGAAGPEPSRSP